MKATVYLPIAVEVEVDDAGSARIGSISIDFDGAPWSDTDREPNVWIDDEWQNHEVELDVMEKVGRLFAELDRNRMLQAAIHVAMYGEPWGEVKADSAATPYDPEFDVPWDHSQVRVGES